jgi:hypothetical protein
MAINRLKPKLDVDLMHTCIKDRSLPPRLRATFCRLMLHMHVDAEPHEAMLSVEYARLWSKLPDSMDIELYCKEFQQQVSI